MTNIDKVLLQPLDILPDSPVGGKAKALASLAEAQLPIPGWFVVLPKAFYKSLDKFKQAALATATTSSEVNNIVGDLTPAAEVGDAVMAAYSKLCPAGEPVAVRSSAAEEDSTKLSFAGQLESYLFVTREQLLTRIADVWRSGFTERITSYTREAGIKELPSVPAVIVQRAVDGEMSGVAFSSDPVSGRRGITVITGVWGMGEALVSGETDADTWYVDRNNDILDRKIVHKHIAVRRDPNHASGINRIAVPRDSADLPVLTDTQVADVAKLARNAECFFGLPQDIEWTWTGETLYLLQSRPITTLSNKPDPDEPLRIWDNTNIIESYSGVTTPFTFSFIRHCYEQVYREFCHLMMVPDQIIKENSKVFTCMLGLLNGRVYYNLVNGYRILTMLPGYKLNRHFTEEMLGFRETLPEEIEVEMENSAVGAKSRDLLLLMRMLWHVIYEFFRLERRITKFYERIYEILPQDPRDLSGESPDDLVVFYRHLEEELLHHWDAPTVNDFFAAIFHGSLRRLTQRWLADETGSLHNDLLCGDHELVSMQIAKLIKKMSMLSANKPELISQLETGSRVQVETALNKHPELARLYQNYLIRFGDRCLDELKLESATVHDDPKPLFHAIAGYARHIGDNATSEENVEERILNSAETIVKRKLASHTIRKYIFRWILEQTRRRVRFRENLRFERTRAFGVVRRIVVEMGRRFAALDLIEQPRDIFYLTLDEILSVVDGTAVTLDLKALTSLRRSEFNRYREMPPIPERFQTRGIPYIGDQFTTRKPSCPASNVEILQGIGCCPGIVRGNISIVNDPRSTVISPGTIVLAQRTDPGWVIVFPTISGLLVERGSMLSHSAIVAREMGLPTIVSIPGLSDILKDGELVEMDGSTGKITRLEASAA